MKILLTGSSGDLGTMLSKSLEGQGDESVGIDLREPDGKQNAFIKGSILDRELLKRAMGGIGCVVHIAAWHGIHLFKKERDVYDFWDLNVTGTFNVFQAAAEAGVDKVVYISSESAAEREGIYGHTKVLGEEIARTYGIRHGMNVIALRPRAFIPFWNKAAYSSWLEWAQWFWKGAVHIDDVNRAVLLSIALLKKQKLHETPVLNVDGAYDYSPEDLETWDAAGKGTSFRKYYGAWYDLAVKHGLDPAQKPETLSIAETAKWLGYKPEYSVRNLLVELEKYGPNGPR